MKYRIPYNKKNHYNSFYEEKHVTDSFSNIEPGPDQDQDQFYYQTSDTYVCDSDSDDYDNDLEAIFSSKTIAVLYHPQRKSQAIALKLSLKLLGLLEFYDVKTVQVDSANMLRKGLEKASNSAAIYLLLPGKKGQVYLNTWHSLDDLTRIVNGGGGRSGYGSGTGAGSKKHYLANKHVIISASNVLSDSREARKFLNATRAKTLSGYINNVGSAKATVLNPFIATRLLKPSLLSPIQKAIMKTFGVITLSR